MAQLLTLTRKLGESIKIGDDNTNVLNITTIMGINSKYRKLKSND